MEEMLVSVVVPIYNSREHLKRCIESILNQSYKNLEILLVDDGSYDSSSDICLYYKSMDERITYVRHDNKGVSFTRNRGIKLSKGEWICFVDSDDCLMVDYVTDLAVDCKGCELVIHSIEIIDSVSGLSSITGPSKVQQNYELKEGSNFLIEIPLLVLASPISKLFKRSILIGENVFFDERISIGEDFLFTVTYLNTIKSVSCSSKSNYIYYREAGGLSTRYNSFEEEVLAEQMLYDVTLRFGNRIKENNIVTLYNEEFRKHSYRILFSLYKNHIKVYSSKERIAKVKSLNNRQLLRLIEMFKLSGTNGVMLSLLFRKRCFFLSNVVLKFLVVNKLS